MRETHRGDEQVTVARTVNVLAKLDERNEIIRQILGAFRNTQDEGMNPLPCYTSTREIRGAERQHIVGVGLELSGDELLRLREIDDVSTEAPGRRDENSGIALVKLGNGEMSRGQRCERVCRGCEDVRSRRYRRESGANSGWRKF
jgi:hypothetical protein